MASTMQIQLFAHLKSKLAEHLSLVDEVASLLGVSTDSAYRRIRGEKELSLEEAAKIASRFQLSLDSLFNVQNEGFLFHGSFLKSVPFDFDEYLRGVVGQVKMMNAFKEKQMYYLCKDVPLFHHFHVREVAAFKYFFWMKTILPQPHFSRKKFSFKDYPEEFFELGRQALEYYNRLDTVEIWNIESINSSIRQVEFHHESGGFENDEDAYRIYDGLEKIVEHLERQAAEGYKFNIEDAARSPQGKFEIYFNEVILGDNSVLALLDGKKIAFLNHSVINIIHTTDMRFTESMYEHIQNLVKKSTLISSVSEGERARFFKYLRNRIISRKQNLKV